MSIIETLQAQEGHEQLKHEIGNFMFDMLNVPLPASQNERFEYPKCPFCKGRPRLVTVKGAELPFPLRTGSPLMLTIPKYRVETCCSATYAKNEDGSLRKNESLSQRQLRQLNDQAEAAKKRAGRNRYGY